MGSMEHHLILSILSLLLLKPNVGGASDYDDTYAEWLGPTKFTLLQRNIALYDEGHDVVKSKTFHGNPLDREQITLWEDGDVPYMFHTSGAWDFSDEEKDVIRRALKHISDNVPCIQFREEEIHWWDYTGNRLIFTTDLDSNLYPLDYCWAYLGLVGNVGLEYTKVEG